MNIFSTITSRTMKVNRTRTLVTIIGVILSTAMITAVTTLGGSFRSFFIQTSISEEGNWHVAGISVPVRDAEKILENPEIKNSAKVTELGYALFDAEYSPMMPYLYVQSLSKEAMDMMPIRLEAGKMPRTEEEVIIPNYLATNMKEENAVKLGDILSLELGERIYQGERLNQSNSYMGTETTSEETLIPKEKREFKVVGIYEQSSLTNAMGAPGYEVYAGCGDTKGAYVDLYLELEHPENAYSFMEEVLKDVGAVCNMDLLRWYGVVDNGRFLMVAGGLMAILLIVIMTGSILLIYNAFSISFRERSAQFGLLSSLGATKKQLRNSMKYEAFAVSLVGIPLGLLSGIGGIGITLRFIGKGLSSWFYGQQRAVPLVVEPYSVAAAVVIAFVTVFLSAWIPSRRIRKLSPMEAIRSSRDIQIRPKEVKTGTWVFRLFGLPGMMADKNYKRDRKKYRTTVVSLSISMVLFTTASLFQIYLIQSGSFVLDAPEADVEFTVNDSEKNREQAAQILEHTEGITELTWYNQGYLNLRMPTEFLNPKIWQDMALGEDGEKKETVISARPIVLPDEKFRELAENAGISAEKFMDTEELRFLYVEETKYYNPDTERYERQRFFQDQKEMEAAVGKLIWPGEGEDWEFSQTGTAVLRDSIEMLPGELKSLGGSLVLLLPEHMYEHFLEIFPLESMSRVYSLKCEDSYQVSEILEKEIKERKALEGSVSNLAAWYEQDRSTLMAIQVLTYGFLILITLIAVANVFNTISANLSLRRKEFAMLRSMGMSPKEFYRMLYYECLIYGVRALIYGTVLTIFVSCLLCKVIGFGADTGFVFPGKALLEAAAGVFLVVFSTMIYTMCKIRKNNIIDELKTT